LGNKRNDFEPPVCVAFYMNVNNLNTAKQVGLTIPPVVLSRADMVIK
jgi:hypothetical protein